MTVKSPEELSRLTQSLLEGQEAGKAESQRRHSLSSEERKLEDAQSRISRRAPGKPTTEDEIRAGQKSMHRKARKQGFGLTGIDSRKTARGQVSTLTPPDRPDR
jgi:hypothetical protein